jgi:hypothetical protein
MRWCSVPEWQWNITCSRSIAPSHSRRVRIMVPLSNRASPKEMHYGEVCFWGLIVVGYFERAPPRLEADPHNQIQTLEHS